MGKLEMKTQAMGKKLWSLLRVGLVMMRKGLISKRKLIMDINLMMKRGKLLGKSIGKNLVMISNHHRHGYSIPRRTATTSSRGFPAATFDRLQRDYYDVFSSRESPSRLVFSHGRRSSTQYLPCLNAGLTDDVESDDASVPLPTTTEIPPLYSCDDILAVEEESPVLSVRVSNYSSDEDECEGWSRPHVDDEAEEFIRRFYEQLRLQRRMQLLQFQEAEYQEMLARGA